MTRDRRILQPEVEVQRSGDCAALDGVMFTDDAVPGLADGSITLTFRNWKRPQAKVGGTFHRGDLYFRVDTVDIVTVGDLTPDQARAAGEADVGGVLRRLRLDGPDVDPST